MQIAGTQSVCKQNIVLATEGKFCSRCGRVLHSECEPKETCSILRPGHRKNDEDAFEDAGVQTRDKAVREIEWRLAWPHYDDMHEHTLKGEFALTDGFRRDFAGAIRLPGGGR